MCTVWYHSGKFLKIEVIYLFSINAYICNSKRKMYTKLRIVVVSSKDTEAQNGNGEIKVNLSIICNTLTFMAMNPYMCSLIHVEESTA